MVRNYLKIIFDKFMPRLFETMQIIQDTAAIQKKISRQMAELVQYFNSLLSGLAAELINYGTSSTIKENIVDSFIDDNWGILEELYVDTFGNIPFMDDEKDNYRKLCTAIIKTSYMSPLGTGLVFAGFGSEEIFPSLHHIYLDGSFNGTIKVSEVDRIDINRDGEIGTILSFAQSDVSDRFLYGVDADVEEQIFNYFCDGLQQYVTYAETSGIGSRTVRKLNNIMDAYKSLVRERYWGSARDRIRQAVFSDIQDIVRHMPKQELATFSEALVHITTIKRKMSAEQETVGGPIDVALISKHEGFVWVKRKHYFPPELNQRYFWRKFGGLKAHEGGDHAAGAE